MALKIEPLKLDDTFDPYDPKWRVLCWHRRRTSTPCLRPAKWQHPPHKVGLQGNAGDWIACELHMVADDEPIELVKQKRKGKND